MSLIPWKIYFDKVTIYWSNQKDKLMAFVKSSYQGDLVSLIPCKIYLDKVTIYWSNQMDNLIVFVKSSYQRDLCLASLVIVYQVSYNEKQKFY